MSTCAKCNARLSPDIDWCPQCFARVPRTGRTVPFPARRETLRDPWAPPEPASPRRSFWRSTETTFGGVAKILVTLGIGGVWLATTFFAHRFTQITGRWGEAFVLFWGVTFALLCAIFLFQLWRPGRRTVPEVDVPVIRRTGPPPVPARLEVRVREDDGGELVVTVPEATSGSEAPAETGGVLVRMPDRGRPRGPRGAG